MNPRRASGRMLSGSPVLIGAVTVLVTMVAVFLSYNANEGLPFVPTYSLTAEVPNSAGLVRGNEVRMGGARVGVVSDIGAKPQQDGTVVARADARARPAHQAAAARLEAADPPALGPWPEVRRDHRRQVRAKAIPRTA